MKKLLILFAVILFGVSATYAQGVWTLNVSWDDSSCDNCTNGYFEVVFSIYDDANSVAIYTNQTISNIDLTESDIDISVPLVESNCDKESETYIPSYSIQVAVYMYCYYGLVPEVICSKSGGDTGVSCYTFYNTTVEVDVGALIPVEK